MTNTENLSIKLTQTVQKGGCAAKVAASELRKILAQVRFPPAHDQLLVDGGLFDDAAIYQITPDVALVQTLDFFTPIVDNPYLFGQIAAANALSDVYAMGGQPRTAMAILAFPIASLPNEVIVEVLQGASDKIKEAGANFVGGHSIDDDTLKFGLSVTGLIHPQKVWSNAGAKKGDVLILTKALGTGTITAALKRQEVVESEIGEALNSMAQLNNIFVALSSSQLANIHAATDITGFGFLGHSLQMAKASQVTLKIKPSHIPKLPRAYEFLGKSFLTKAHRTNREYVNDCTQWSFAGNSPTDLDQLLMLDPQTSGGLLLSVEASVADEILASLKSKFPSSSVVGFVDTCYEVGAMPEKVISFE